LRSFFELFDLLDLEMNFFLFSVIHGRIDRGNPYECTSYAKRPY